MTPEAKHAEFFGFYAFSGKLSSILGPLLFGTVVGATGSHRLAMGSMVIFFVVGFVLLMLVDEKAGIEAAREGPLLEPESPAEAPDPTGRNGEPAPEEPRDEGE
jgi:UMF1 family MFS transporter